MRYWYSLRTSRIILIAGWVAIACLCVNFYTPDAFTQPAAEISASSALVEGTPFPIEPPTGWTVHLNQRVFITTIILLLLSAFFSSSEVALFSLDQVKLRSLREKGNTFDRLVGRLMDHPGNILTTILMGNSIVNVSLGIILGGNVEAAFAENLDIPEPLSYALAVALCTAVLVFFGEIMPKIIGIRNGEAFARFVAAPLYVIDRSFMPLRDGLLAFMGLIFRLTRISEVRPAPFITDDEFKEFLSESEATGVIEEEERQMIQGILEFGDVMVKEILVPRPDMIAIPKEATIGEALELVRTEDYSRMPVYSENLDHIEGVLYAKDLLPYVIQAKLELPILPLLRQAHYVPETMSVADFTKTAQQLHAHLAIVVDEFGGTEGLVTLQDALREVVGDIGDEEEDEAPPYKELSPGLFYLEGNLPLDEFEALTGLRVQDAEHTTVAGFLMDHTEKLLEEGDEIEYEGIVFTVEKMEGKRLERLKMRMPDKTEAPEGEEA